MSISLSLSLSCLVGGSRQVSPEVSPWPPRGATGNGTEKPANTDSEPILPSYSGLGGGWVKTMYMVSWQNTAVID